MAEMKNNTREMPKFLKRLQRKNYAYEGISTYVTCLICNRKYALRNIGWNYCPYCGKGDD